MSDDDQSTAVQDEEQSTLIIPEDTANQFPDLVKLVKGSHSMDEEERQYWVDVLPIMSEEQVQNLREILDNEKQQIQEASDSYAKGMDKVVKKVTREFDETAYLEKKKARVDAEKLHEEEEEGHEAALLKELDEL